MQYDDKHQLNQVVKLDREAETVGRAAMLANQSQVRIVEGVVGMEMLLSLLLQWQSVYQRQNCHRWNTTQSILGPAARRVPADAQLVDSVSLNPPGDVALLYDGHT